jgi:hypothetical protein
VSDLVIEELRYLHDQDETGRESTIYSRAANEIERLWALADAAAEILEGWTGPQVDKWLARYRKVKGL